MVAADERTAISFSLSPGHAADGPEGRKLLAETDWNLCPEVRAVIMDRAYEGNETRQLVLNLKLEPVVPPKSTRLSPWEYDRELHKRRNEVERPFRRLKGFSRIFSHFENLDVIFTAYIQFALVVEALRGVCVNTP